VNLSLLLFDILELEKKGIKEHIEGIEREKGIINQYINK
jgi:hypothetical protein